MKKAAIKKLKEKVKNQEKILGMWVTLESASITEIAVALGLDYVIIDAEHGHLDWKHILEHVRASVRSDTVVLVRITDVQEGLIKRVLDIGADGIVVPHIETVEQLQQAVAYAKYPPRGIRGIGAERATGWGQSFMEHIQDAEDILVVPIIESIKGGENIKALATVDEVDMFYFGPADYAASAGYAGQWDVPDVNKLIDQAKNVLLKAGKACGVVAMGDEDIQNRLKQGYRMIGIGFDTSFIIKGIKSTLANLGTERNIKCDFTPSNGQQKKEEKKPLGPPPAEYSPDREEAIYNLGDGQKLELGPGVKGEILVGEHTNAKNLTTGIVTFEAGPTHLESHSHPHAESITLLSGQAMVTVDNRRYVLNAFDNITVPRDVPHSVRNLSYNSPAVFHVAFPTSRVERKESKNSYEKYIDVPADFSGSLGPELFTRFKTAHRYDAGSNTEFVDYFNDEMLPGVGMSGGFGLFHEDGRLPAHIHDFDESICITEGEAFCFVEGRKYEMSNKATAMQPRGRVHYFVNNSKKTMSIIWVYAGAMPERIQVADEYATIGMKS